MIALILVAAILVLAAALALLIVFDDEAERTSERDRQLREGRLCRHQWRPAGAGQFICILCGEDRP